MRVPCACVVAASLVACGAGEIPAAAPPASPAAHAAPRAEGGGATAAERLQGTWEITRYVSTRPIPDEAMPMMGALFDVLRLRFEGATATATAGKVAESMPFAIEGEQGGRFTLRVRGGMFDGAEGRFLEDDRVELRDKGKAWPGVSVLERTR